MLAIAEDTSRETATELMRMNEYVDLLIPRGGKGLIRSVVENATVPTIETGAGNCNAYVEKSADFETALSIIRNGKTSRPAVCNALEHSAGRPRNRQGVSAAAQKTRCPA